MTRTRPLGLALLLALLLPAAAHARLGDLLGTTELPAGTSLRAVELAPGGAIAAGGSAASGAQMLVARFGADGTPDPAFGPGGTVTWDPGGDSAEVAAVAVESGGSVLAAGSSFAVSSVATTHHLFRVTPGNATAVPIPARPTALTDSAFTDVAVLPDGRIVVAGWGETIGRDVMLVGRFEADGDPDPAFNAPGVEFGWRLVDFGGTNEARAEALSIGADGSVTLAGRVITGGAAVVQRGAAARVTASGALDTGFAGDGTLIVPAPATSAFAGAALRGEDLLAAGSRGAEGVLQAITAAGAPGTAAAWGGAGEDVVVTTGGGAVVAGRTSDNRLQAAWLTPAGVADPAPGGVRDFQVPLQSGSPPAGAALAPGDALVVATTGVNRTGLLARFAPNAAPVPALAVPAQVETGAPAVLDAAASSDPEGEALRYAFDLDGDGTFEFDGGQNPLALRSFPAPGTATVAVRVTDPRGASAVAQRTIDVVPAAGPVPQPVLGEQGVARPVRGVIRIKLPGERRFRRIDGLTAIPNGTVIDATRGRVLLTVLHDASGRLDGARFYAGRFRFRQSEAAVPVTTLTLSGGSFSGCDGSVRTLSAFPVATASAEKKKGRRLWGDGRGKFRTRGRYGAATVRGTKWLTEDRCGGTFVRVVRGKVDVQDLVRTKRRPVRLTAGEKVLIAKRGR